MVWFGFFLFVFSLCWVLTGLLRRYALATNLLDIPNHRSSHVVPTPRGGGLAFIVSFLAAVLFLFYLDLISFSLSLALLGSGTFVAILGFLDDRRSIPARWRLLGHFVVAGFSIYVLGGMPSISVFNWIFPAGVLINILAVFYLVWLLNLYNFMDGIDGIAAVEAVTVCLGGALLYYLCGDETEIRLPLTLTVAVGGFLCWNFPPARIFMGDAGSGFLGMVLGILSIQAARIDGNFFWAWLILLGVFIVDATITLLCRAYRGEVLLQAHCSHAYQNASRRYNTHLPVTMGVLVINLLWLFPMAMMVGLGFINGSFGLLIAYLPLVVLAFKFNAGKRE
ncbi:alpha-N-acetylglucosaminyltransferase [Legionella lansingensis]|uniref:Alpha-N-acetylglucosaminyltransferase n=1 Tax=Legionella lansingensis TaxID=45067 RepID=A0A0W0VWF7_9GAMM|nr:glycosyltransferase family 4 protein [Legionella lansingensis]KTD24344.1 alpha-N-acetylglucosaminyltransferase [Legionella lansingensis]SNV51728.1 alpha-N-acetylglucosaminyltransferase [Legionella lansingensis]